MRNYGMSNNQNLAHFDRNGLYIRDDIIIVIKSLSDNF
jgi:hypothetical protein